MRLAVLISSAATGIVPRDPCANPMRRSRVRQVAGVTLVEAVMAVAIIGIALFAIMTAISRMRIESRASSQRVLAASVGNEILELFKALPYTDIRNSTVAEPVFLKGYGGPTPNAAWRVPAAGAGSWQALPVEAVDASSAANPALIGEQLPQGQWRVEFVSDAITSGTREIRLWIRWNQTVTANLRPSLYQLSTMVCQAHPDL